MIRLEIEAGAERFIYDYDADAPLTIGRAPGCELVIGHSDVSRQHCEIRPTSDGFVVKDLGSRNGVLLGGSKVTEARILPGQVIAMGAEVRVRFGEPAPAPPSLPDVEPPPAPKASPKPEASPEKGPEKVVAARKGEQRPDEAEADSDPGEGKATPRRRTYRARSGGSVILTYGVAAVLLVAGAVTVKKLLIDPLDARLEATQSGAGGGSRSGPRAARPADDVGTAEAERAFLRLEAESLPPELLLAAFEDHARRYPETSWGEKSRARADALRRVMAAGGGAPQLRAGTLEAEVDRLLEGAAYAEAYAVAEMCGRLRLVEPGVARSLEQRASTRAYDRFARAREEARGHLGAGRALQAYEALAPWRAAQRLPFYAEVEQERASVLAALEKALAALPVAEAATPQGERSLAELEILGPEAARALARCDFDGAVAVYGKILALPLPERERLRYEWRSYDARRARALFQELLLELGQSAKDRQRKLYVTVTQAWKGEAVLGDAASVRIEVEIPGEKSRPVIEKKWRDTPPIWVVELLSCLELDGDGLLGLAAFAFELGYEDAAHGALVGVYERWPAFREEAASLLARRTGTSVRAQDLVVFEGRLVPKAERDALLAARQAEKDRKKALDEELAASKLDERAKRILDEAEAMLQRGAFVAGMELVRAVAKKVPDSELGQAAKARAESPFLRRYLLPVQAADLVPPKPNGLFDRNRVSFYFIGEGYQLDDAQQRAFDGVARSAQRILATSEPWKEYGGYFQYYAANAWSKDQGLDRMPGDVQKDTPFGGGVRDGTYTIQNGLVRRFLDAFPGPSIGVVLGNDSASVATGGGGACAVVKGMIDVCGHEIGHAMADLGDEYQDDPSGAPGPSGRAQGKLDTTVLGPNLIGGNQREDMLAKAPWRHWIALGVNNWTGQAVDLFEGGNRVPFDVWRPQRDCKMRTSASPFCAPCMEQMILAIYRRVRPIDEASPKADEPLTVRAGKAETFRIATLKPKSRFLEVSFELVRLADEGETVGREAPAPKPMSMKWTEVPDGRAVYTAKTEPLEAGRYEVRVTVKDPTPWVAQADRTTLGQTLSWSVRVE